MTDKRATPARPARRQIDLAPNPFADAPAVAAVVAIAGKPEVVGAAAAAAKRTKVAPKAAAAEPPMIDPDLREGEESWNEGYFKLTVNIPISLHRRASGVVLHHSLTGEPFNISSLTDLVRIGVSKEIRLQEEALNGGGEFPAPKAGLRRGRR